MRLGFDTWMGRSPGGGMATHSSLHAWRIPWTEEPGGLQLIGLQELDTTEDLVCMQGDKVEKEMAPTPVTLPGESQGRGA